MHLTFVSLFMSMRRMGSNYWLATTVLFSSVFAFLFGLIVTTKLGVSINMVLLSEGLPFLVVTIGFEKPIVLTKAVLSASLSSRRQGNQVNGVLQDNNPKTIQFAVQKAMGEKGFEIVRDYAIEVAILVAGAASGVQGGLRQFCFLAAWILIFDCLLLFTFYTAILSIKLEINRIKSHIALRRALEEDGVSRRVAENVASSHEWPRLDDSADGDGEVKKPGVALFGKRFGDSSIPKFKLLMVGGFVLINVLNLCTIPFRAGNKNAAPPTVSGLSSVLTSPLIDPFKVAENGLDAIYNSARDNSRFTIVTILPPIKYELQSPLTPPPSEDSGSIFDAEYTDQLLDVVGGRVIEGVLKSLEDPVLSKWIFVALILSLVLNGYLFNAARWSIKDLRHPQEVPCETNSEQQYDEETLERIRRGHGDDEITDRTQEDCEKMLRDRRAAELTDKELIDLTVRGKIPGYALEKTLENPRIMTRLDSLTRAVKIRRAVVSRTSATSANSSSLLHSKLPYENFNYERVFGACCENVLGYLPIPLGVAGPLLIDGCSYFLPMATTEGVLVASTHRGCKAINAGGGAVTVLTGDGMTRGPCGNNLPECS